MRLNYFKWLGLMGILTLVLTFQNCGGVNITPKPAESSFSVTSMDGELCSLPTVSNDSWINFVFIVDMSGSNVRQLLQGGGGYTRTHATDVPGQRFQVIRDFLNSPCLQNRSNVRFTVFGFSSTTVPGSTACLASRLIDKASVNSQISDLENLQTTAVNLVNANVNATISMQATNYGEAFECGKDLISGHINTLTADEKSKNFYQVMFMSDGAATSPSGTALNQTQFRTAVYDKVDALLNVTKSAEGGIVQPILYGNRELQGYSMSEYNLATTIMDGIAAANKKGTGILKVLIDDLGNFDFCDVFNGALKAPFMVSSFGLINMTAIMKNGRLLADSDMDGIPDNEELSRGFNPTKNRSWIGGNEMIDGVCKFDAINCRPVTCGQPNSMGLTDCETNSLSLHDGLDEDRDGAPDFVEFLKGTLPALDDMHIDTDGDGVININELLVGREPNFSDSNINPLFLIDVKRQLATSATATCPSQQERWIYSTSNIPLVDTLETEIDPADSVSPKNSNWLLHDAGENIIFVYYTVEEQNAANGSAAQLYGKFIKLKQGQSIYIDNYEKLGELDGHFKPIP